MLRGNDDVGVTIPPQSDWDVFWGKGGGFVSPTSSLLITGFDDYGILNPVMT